MTKMQLETNVRVSMRDGLVINYPLPTTSDMNIRPRFLAFYLPQFHPIAENDLWWGRGFTEWTNVARAKPLFKGHYQPHVPADLGFYDLRLPETRAAQARLAQKYGIEGFCYWHYWFDGKQLLERPFNEVLRSGEPNFPFCLAWANETWSRRWLGEEKEILLKQTYSKEDDNKHIEWLLSAFSDERYIRVNGHPLFLIYRPLDLPEPKRTADIFRSNCLKSGLPEPFLLGMNAHAPAADFRSLGFDGTIAFKPELGVLPYFLDDELRIAKLKRNWRFGILSPKLKIYDYSNAQKAMLRLRREGQDFPCVFVGWDNSPRRGRDGIILTNTSTSVFESVLDETVRSLSTKPPQEQIIFLNAWNEWAEGNHLEPDLKFGHEFLKSVSRINEKNSGPVEKSESAL